MHSVELVCGCEVVTGRVFFLINRYQAGPHKPDTWSHEISLTIILEVDEGAKIWMYVM